MPGTHDPRFKPGKLLRLKRRLCLARNSRGLKRISHSQSKPRPQRRGSAKGHGVELGGKGLPKDGRAVGQTVDAQTLVNGRTNVGCGVPEPYRTSLFGFADLDEAVLASNRLKILEFLHRDLSLHRFRRCFPTMIPEGSCTAKLGVGEAGGFRILSSEGVSAANH
jgi:hypothetical protein